MDADFEWDARKAAGNRRKHGISFEDAVTAFADPLAVTVIDPDHSSAAERRYILVGRSERGRLLVVSHAERGTAIRVISARPATRRERAQYEEGEF
jgi:uncharacterized DUF497 family protein